MYKKLLLTGVLLSFFSSLSLAQDEQVTVIGSLIKGTPIDTGSPISTFNAQEVAAQNNLNIVELIKMVPGSSGMDGEANQFGSNASEGIANVNLRGLGTNRTLVLINGKRQVTVPIATGAGRSVNLNDLPMSALSRIEILKEGAAATYGSDAIAGVVNFITDSNFEGLRVNFGAKGISGAEQDGNEFSITYGTALNDGTNFLLSLGAQKKGELRAENTEYVRRSFKENGVGGWSSFGNPGTFVFKLDDGDDNTDAPTGYVGDPGCNASGGYAQLLSTDSTVDHKDAAGNVVNTTNMGGYHTLCRYQYAYFDNVQEEQTNSQLWMEFNGDVNGEHDFHVEFSYGKTNVPNYATSPSYPPNNPIATVVPNYHPGLQALYGQHPAFATLLKGTAFGGDGTTQRAAHAMFARPFAVAGNPNGASNGAENEFRKYDVYRFAFNFEGSLTDGVEYSTGLNYSQSEGNYTFSDTQQNKYNSALWGYGGPNCPYEMTALSATGVPTMTHKVTGVNATLSATPPAGCGYLNIFSNAFEQGNQAFYDNKNPFTDDNQVGTSIKDKVGKNPHYLPAQKNDPDFLRWLVDRGEVEAKSTLMTADFTIQGFMGALSGGDAAWAFGYERREYNLEQSLPSRAGTRLSPTHDIFDGNKHPCLLPKDNRSATARASCLSSNPAGLFMFLAPAYGRDQSQEVDSLFAEFALPILDNFDMQLALRYEDYGTVDSVDPKVVLRWTPIDALTLRFTGQTTFRAPNPDEIWDKRSTSLSYVAQTGAFKAIDTTGNPNLDPEEATTYNFGIITDFGTDNWTATVDYYNFEFDNPIITEAYAQIAAAYEAGAPGSSPTAAQTAAFNAIKGQVRGGPNYLTDGSFAASEIARIETQYVNGPQTETDGVDIYVRWEDDYGNGTLSAGMEAAYVIDYSVAAYSKGGAQIAGAYECAGYFNVNFTCRSMPDLKSKAFVNYVTDQHNFYGAINYISSYEDRRSSVEIAPHTTVDATYTYSWDDFSMSFSAYNLTDEQPPFTLWEMSYDPNTHSPLGRYFKVGFTYNME